jgi:hypothetical protein
MCLQMKVAARRTAFLITCPTLYNGHTDVLLCIMLQVYFSSIVEPQYANGKPLPPEPNQALQLTLQVLAKGKIRVPRVFTMRRTLDVSLVPVQVQGSARCAACIDRFHFVHYTICIVTPHALVS